MINEWRYFINFQLFKSRSHLKVFFLYFILPGFGWSEWLDLKAGDCVEVTSPVVPVMSAASVLHTRLGQSIRKKTNLSKIVKLVKNCQNVIQVMFPHPDLMSKGNMSEGSVLLFQNQNVREWVSDQSVTRSPIEVSCGQLKIPKLRNPQGAIIAGQYGARFYPKNCPMVRW